MRTRLTIEEKIENLTNDGMIDIMFFEKRQYFGLHKIWINKNALWQKWIRA